jgi:hypothetical protein
MEKLLIGPMAAGMSTPYPYRPYIPQNVSEIMDLLGSIMLSPPTMRDELFPERNVDTQFFALNKGLQQIRAKLGEERYAKAIELSNRMRAHFEADPHDTNGKAHIGYLLIHELEALLNNVPSKQKS